MAFAVWLEPGVVAGRFDFTMDDHGIASIDRAVNATLCGQPSVLSTEYNLGGYMSTHTEASYVPLADLVARAAGSIERYCAGHMISFVPEDNGLSLFEEAMLRVRPSLTANGIAHSLAALRLIAIASSCALLLAFGSSVVFAGAVAVAAVAVCRNLIDAFMAYSAHSLFFVMVLLNAVSMTVVAMMSRTAIGLKRALAGGTAGGVVAAFAVSVRASYLPVYACFLLCACWAVLRPPDGGSRQWRRAGSIAIGFIVGYLAFQYVFINRRVPVEIANDAASSTHHSIGHPLVLGLAVPDNALAKSEGIVWDDGAGTTLARRIRPGVVLLGPGYEDALLTYYRGLWRRYPRQMADLYFLKLQTAGAQMLRTGRFGEEWIRPVLWPLRQLPNGIYLGAVFLISAILSLVAYARRPSGLALYVGMLCLAGLLLYLESAIIMPVFYVSYHNYLLLIALIWSFVFYQAALNVAVGGIRLLLARPGARQAR